jgi:hypothetical protein
LTPAAVAARATVAGDRTTVTADSAVTAIAAD